VPRGPDFPELSHQINKFAIRGVELQYRVTMTYQPPFWRLSLALAAAGLLGWAGFVARWVAVVRFRRGASANA